MPIKTKISYETSDGQVFSTRAEAQEYERTHGGKVSLVEVFQQNVVYQYYEIRKVGSPFNLDFRYSSEKNAMDFITNSNLTNVEIIEVSVYEDGLGQINFMENVIFSNYVEDNEEEKDVDNDTEKRYLHIAFSDNDFMNNRVVFESIQNAIRWVGYEYFYKEDLQAIKEFIISIWNAVYNISKILDTNKSNRWWEKNYPEEYESHIQSFNPNDISEYLNSMELHIVSKDQLKMDNYENAYIPLFDGEEAMVM